MHKTTQRQFLAIDVPQEVSPEAIDRLIADCGGQEDTYHIRKLVDQYGAQEALTMLFAKLDQRKITLIILCWGLNGDEPFGHNQLSRHFGVTLETVRDMIRKARAQIRSNALSLM